MDSPGWSINAFIANNLSLSENNPFFKGMSKAILQVCQHICSMSFNENGFEIINGIVDEFTILSIINELEIISSELSGAGIRNAEKRLNSIKTLVNCPTIKSRVSHYLTGTPQLVRAILFIKSNKKNWLASWHQDKTITVSSKFEREGWSPWSRKDGVLHVQPPVEVLNQMVTLRIHLDDSSKENGCLKILPKSHLAGLMSNDQIDRCAKVTTPIYCIAPRGSALVMRPHILHASSKSTTERLRRVLHVEFSNFQLPRGIHWS